MSNYLNPHGFEVEANISSFRVRLAVVVILLATVCSGCAIYRGIKYADKEAGRAAIRRGLKPPLNDSWWSIWTDGVKAWWMENDKEVVSVAIAGLSLYWKKYRASRRAERVTYNDWHGERQWL